MIRSTFLRAGLLPLVAAWALALGFLSPVALAAPGDSCVSPQGTSVDQLCNVSAGELCVNGTCQFVSLEQGGTGLSIPTGQVKVSESIVQDRSLGDLIVLVVNYLIGFLGLVATVMFIAAGVMLVTAGGDDGRIDKAKSIMTYAVVGILIVIFSYSIVQFVTRSASSGTESLPPGSGGSGPSASQCSVTSDCPAGNYCANGQCQGAQQVSCVDDSQCGPSKQCSPLGYCYNPLAEGSAPCQNSSDCFVGFLCNAASKQCELAGNGNGGLVGGDTQAASQESLQNMDSLIKGLSDEIDSVNKDINDLSPDLKGKVVEALASGFLADKAAGIQSLLAQTEDPASLAILERIAQLLGRLGDLREEFDALRTTMPESIATIEAWDQASNDLDESVADPRSSLKFRRFEKGYTALKQILRQFPLMQSRIRALPAEGNVPFTVTLNGLDSVDPTGGTISDYKWSYLDSQGSLVSLGNAPVVIHTFTEPNTYSVRLQVSTSQVDGAGYKTAMEGVSTIRIKASPPASLVNFRINGVEAGDVYHATTEEARLGLAFDPSSTVPALGRSIQSYEWFFGDGNTERRGSSSAVIHGYAKAGEYNVTLETRDSVGEEDKKTVKLLIQSLAASVKADPAEGDVTTEYLLDGSESRSDNGVISEYRWEVLDYEDNLIEGFADPTVSYRFASPGTYKAALTVTDTGGRSDRQIRYITVRSRPPVANFSYFAPSKNRPNHFQFSAASSYDPDMGDPISYSWDFNGDGAFEVVDSRDLLAQYTYPKAGEYRAVLQVEDSFRQRHQAEKVIKVDSVLGGEIRMGSKAVQVDEIVSFEASSPKAVAYLWEFGDGQTASTESKTIDHAYSKKGKYKVTLHFFDRNDESNTDTAFVLVGDQDSPLALAEATVNEHTPLLTEDACGAGKSAMAVTRSEQVLLSGEDSSNSDGTPRLLDYAWEVSEGVRNTGRNFSYRFQELTAPGECAEISLAVRDQISGKTSEKDTLYFQVVNRTPSLADFLVEPLGKPETPLRVRLKAVLPSDQDGAIKRYRWWAFREGNEEERLGMHSTAGPETEMVITAQGQPGVKNRYVFVLEMTDNDGGIYTTLNDFGSLSQLEVANGSNLSPVAEFTMDKTTIAVGDTVSFSSKSYDPQGDELPASAFRWDFDGDGNFDDVSSGPAVSRQFNTPGQFEVRLRVTYEGLSSSAAHTVNVQPTNSFPQAAFTYSIKESTASFEGRHSRYDPDLENETLRYEWDFDARQDADGNGVADDDVQSTEPNPSYTYPQPSSYRARLRVKDSLGMTGVAVREVNLGLNATQLQQNTLQSMEVSSLGRPMTTLSLRATPVNLSVGGSAELTAKVLNADKTPYRGTVFFEIVEGSGELTPNPVPAKESEAVTVFTATAPGPVRLRARATGTYHGELFEDMVLRAN